MRWSRTLRRMAAALLALAIVSSVRISAMQGGGIPPGRFKIAPGAWKQADSSNGTDRRSGVP